MEDREKHVKEMVETIDNWIIHHPFSSISINYGTGEVKKIAETLYDEGFRKMEEVTLRIDLGDCTPEQINEIMEKFSKAAETPCVAVPINNEEEISKKVAKDILQAITNNNKAMGVDDCFLIELAEEYGVEVN